MPTSGGLVGTPLALPDINRTLVDGYLVGPGVNPSGVNARGLDRSSLNLDSTTARPTLPPALRSEELDIVRGREASPGIEDIMRVGGHRLEAEGIVIGEQDDRVGARDLLGGQVYERDLTADLRRIHKWVGSPDIGPKL
jgi:hypothetical protein